MGKGGGNKERLKRMLWNLNLVCNINVGVVTYSENGKYSTLNERGLEVCPEDGNTHTNTPYTLISTLYLHICF